MTIPGQILITVYLAIMGILGIFAALQMFHALNFGQRIFRTVLTSAIFIGCFIFVLWIAAAALSPVSWSRGFEIGAGAVLSPS